MIIEKDVMVEVRDGSQIATDIFRPSSDGVYPVIVSMSPYGKDVFWPDRFPLYELVDNNQHMVWETENPEFWVEHGYVVVRADTRGTGKSPGYLQLLGRQEQEDAYDVVEWAGVQEWSTGKVGMSGISWYAMLAWLVAAMQPPHLTAIIPWDGLTDFYREWAYQGGILHNQFTPNWWERFVGPNQYGIGKVSQEDLRNNRADLADEIVAHQWADDWFKERSVDLNKVEIPFLSASSWGSLHLHLRGNVEGFVNAKSKYKRLHLFPEDHITPFYKEWAKDERLRFFDFWLKDESNGLLEVPPVRLTLRDGDLTIDRYEDEWPIARTKWIVFPLDFNGLTFSQSTLPAGTKSYEAPTGYLELISEPFEGDLEITGPASLHLNMSTNAKEADVFVALEVIDEKGNLVPARGILGQVVPHATGLLRASHRELDVAKSTIGRPFHHHLEASKVENGEIFKMDIEIWPTSIILHDGYRLRLLISSNDFWHGTDIHHDGDVDRAIEKMSGVNTFYSSSSAPSSLVLPVIPNLSLTESKGSSDA